MPASRPSPFPPPPSAFLPPVDLAYKQASRYLPRPLHWISVPGTDTSRPCALSGRTRLTAIVFAFGLLGLLAVAVFAKPNPNGVGTHQQFGFPPCTFRVLFDRPCPSCGMTTSWAHLVRGQLVGALRANVGGTLLAAIAILITPWLLISAIRGRWLVCEPRTAMVAWMAFGIVLITLIDWAIRLVVG